MTFISSTTSCGGGGRLLTITTGLTGHSMGQTPYERLLNQDENGNITGGLYSQDVHARANHRGGLTLVISEDASEPESDAQLPRQLKVLRH
jgi:hypothetical protein